MSTDLQPPISQDGRTWAYLSYVSMLTGLPLFIVPFIQKNDAYAIFHARQAAVAYIAGFVLLAVYIGFMIVTCGFGGFIFPILLLPYVPMIHGFILVSNGEWKEPVGVFGLGDKLFGSVQVEQR